ncbi:MAG: hypothetical protein ACRCU1_19885 [Alsobacter sp.]
MRAMIATALVCVVAAATPASAQSRPDSLTMTCSAAQALVRERGAIVIGTGPNVFDRFVADRRFCMPTQVTQNAFITTRDNRNCLVGGICRENVPINLGR